MLLEVRLDPREQRLNRIGIAVRLIDPRRERLSGEIGRAELEIKTAGTERQHNGR